MHGQVTAKIVEVTRILLISLAVLLPSQALAGAVQVDFLLSGLQSAGAPLSGGKVYTCAAGTTTPKTCYTDKAKTTPIGAYISLDANGTALAYCEGNYKFVIQKSDGSTVYTRDNLVFTSVQGTVVTSGADLANPPSSGKIIIDTPITLTANTTLPSGLEVEIINGGMIVKASTYTFTINGAFKAGPHQVFSGFAVGQVTFGAGSVGEYLPEWWYDSGGDWSTALACALAADGGVSPPLNVPVKLSARARYTYTTTLSFQQNYQSLVGSGMSSRLYYTGTGHAIEVGTTTAAEGVLFKDFILVGTSSATAGIVYGSSSDSTKYASLPVIDHVWVYGFSKTGTPGMQINNLFQGDFIVKLTANYRGIHKPDPTDKNCRVTTTVFRTGWGEIAVNTAEGVKLEGTTSTSAIPGAEITFEETVFMSNPGGDIYSTVYGSAIYLERTYHESSALTAGTSVVYVTSAAGAYMTSLKCEKVKWHVPADRGGGTYGPNIKVDYANLRVMNNGGLMGVSNPPIMTTAHSNSFFFMNHDYGGSDNAPAFYNALLGKVAYIDLDSSGNGQMKGVTVH